MVIERRIRNEAQYSLAGEIDLTPYIQKGLIVEEEIASEEQEKLFYYYFNRRIGKSVIHKEAACLALAISKGYSLASDEKVVMEEFKRRCPGKICVNSWGIVKLANKLGLINKTDADDLRKGLFHT